MRVLGVDVWSTRWIGVVLEDGVFERALVDQSLGALISTADAADRHPLGVVGVDIPLGSVAGGQRVCDEEARAFASGFGSSIFPAPPREALRKRTYAAANSWCRREHGFGLTRQSWSLGPKIAEADAVWRRRAPRLYEVHPEVSFRAMAGDRPELHSAPKRSWDGHRQRVALLRRWGIAMPADLGDAGRAGADDVLDAAAAAWSAHHIAAGRGEHFTRQRDEDGGRLVTIWY